MNDQKALDYHQNPRPGKIATHVTKSVKTQEELSLAYSPGVAIPCLEINKDTSKVFDYTNRANTVAVITDGTAVLGLGDIGPGASMPVMEGKCVLLKKFADIDGIPLALQSIKQPEQFINIVTTLEPSFGAINLEDIAAPACFPIEEQSQAQSSIPIFHDDQHGTAIIAIAAIQNSLQLLGKHQSNVKIVINGAGAAGIACVQHFVAAGIPQTNITIVDSKGVIYQGREQGMNEYKSRYATQTPCRTLEEAISGADIFLGVSAADILTPQHISSMNSNPIILALANPNPEIKPELAIESGAAIIATGRSDYPNQVNNVLGFPGLFRGALDVRATQINQAMKLAASQALVELSSETIPDDIKQELSQMYPIDAQAGVFDQGLSKNLIIPKPFDRRVVPRVAKHVARAAMKTNVATVEITDLEDYEQRVANRIKKANT